MLSILKKIFVTPVKYEVVSGDTRDLEREKMYELQNKSSKEMWIVAGELDKQFYNEKFVNIIKDKLEKIPDFRVNILFSKDATLSLEERIKLVYEENTQLCNLLKGGAFGGRFSMFLSTKRPEYHFGIVDSSILIEKIHEPKANRDVLLVDNYNTLIEKYKRYFIKLIKEPDSDNKIKQLSFNDFQNIAA